MRNKGTFLLMGLCGIGLALGQSGQLESGSFRDKAQNLYARNLSSWSFKTISASLRSFTFKSQAGKKVVATFAKQRIQLEASMIVGQVLISGGSAFDLREADLTGGVTTTVERDSGLAGSKAPQTTTINASSAHFDAQKSTVSSLGAISFINVDPPLSRTLKATGSKGTITLSESPKANNGVSKAVIEGPVTIEMRGVRDEKNEKTGKVGKVPYLVTGRGARMVYDATLRTVTLTGDVRIDGDDPVLGGDLRATKAVLTMDGKGEIVSVDFEGPGETILRDKSKGGGR